MDSYLVACVHDSLSLFLYDNAKFLCERLVASYPSELGKLQEAEVALKKFGESEVPNGAAGFYLLGKICNLCGGRTKEAARYFSKALKLNPLMWNAYEELCSLGEDESAAEFCKSVWGSAACSESSSVHITSSAMSTDNSCAESTPPSSCQALPVSKSADRTCVPQSSNGVWHSPSAFCTPGPPAHVSGPPGLAKKDVPFPGFQTGSSAGGKSSHAGPQRVRDEDRGKMRKLSGRLLGEPSALVRRSARLASKDSGHGSTPSNPSKASRDSTPADRFDNGRLPGTPAQADATQSCGVPEVHQKEADALPDGNSMALKVLAPIFEGYRHLCLYRCHEAVQAFQRLPPEQFHTGWVLHQIGRAHFEVVEYKAAAEAFEACRRKDMHRVEGMEVFSTVLWHMKDETKLNHLAQEIHSLDRLSPHAWCVMGNCLSLQKDHENALTTFQRALQLDPSFTYAYTLCGHEYFANEDFDKGLSCYQNAIRRDPRHYNALYGIGQINFHQEKFEQAMKHFEMALSINNRSSVLKCYLGMTLHRLHRYNEALLYLKDAIAADPKNPLARYEKANALISMERYPEALQELQDLKDIAPREASVWFAMGKLFKKLNNLDAAMMHYQMARDLNPSSSDVSLIKSAMEKLEVTDENEDDDL